VATKEEKARNRVSFVAQRAPVDDPERALYAIVRSIMRAMVDQLPQRDIQVLNTPKEDLTLNQLAAVSRLHRDKGMAGDGFEWAVHEAITGREPRVIEPLSEAMQSASPKFKTLEHPTSLLFGQERARYNGFLDAVVDAAADEAIFLPDGRGHPPKFAKWIREAARGEIAESALPARLRKTWQTDLFISDQDRHRQMAVTIKSNKELLTGGPGLRIGIVPEHADLPSGISRQRTKSGDTLWVVTLADPSGFWGLYKAGFSAVAETITTLGHHDRKQAYWDKPIPPAVRLQEQLERYGASKVSDIEDGLNEFAQHDLVGVDTKLLSVDAPSWLRLGSPDADAARLAPKPSFALS
jgi:hypothetical protein